MNRQQMITVSCLIASMLFFLAAVFERTLAFVPLGVLFLVFGGLSSERNGKTL